MRRNTGFLLGASEYLAKLIRLYQCDPNGRPVGSRRPILIMEDDAALRELPHSIVAHILQKGRYGCEVCEQVMAALRQQNVQMVEERYGETVAG